MAFEKGFANGFKWFITMTLNSAEFEDEEKTEKEEVAERFGRVAQAVSDLGGSYIDGYVDEVKPTGDFGESSDTKMFLISGNCDSTFMNIFKYKDSLKKLVESLRKEFKLSVLSVEIMPIEVYYDVDEAFRLG